MHDISPETLPSTLSPSLHALSHRVQSHLTRLMANTTLLAQSQSTQVTQDSQTTILELSRLLRTLFDLLSHRLDPYEPQRENNTHKIWWKEFEKSGKKLFPHNTFFYKSGLENDTLQLDFELLGWSLLQILEAVSHWSKKDSSTQVSLTHWSKSKIEVSVDFSPSVEFTHYFSAPEKSENETFQLGWFYFSAGSIGLQRMSHTTITHISQPENHQIAIVILP